MDGNRRWGRRKVQELQPTHEPVVGSDGMYSFLGHIGGIARVWSVVRALQHDTRVSELTLYTLTCANVSKRSESEISVLYVLISLGLLAIAHVANIKLYIIGDIENLSQTTQLVLAWVIRLNRLAISSSKEPASRLLRVNIAMHYDETSHVKATVLHKQTAVFNGSSEPDLWSSTLGSTIDAVIRTGGRQRLSGFFPLETAHAELFFTDTFWPDFTPHLLNATIESLMTRTRTLGGNVHVPIGTK